MRPQIPLNNLPKFPVALGVIGQSDNLSSFWVSWPSNGGTTNLAVLSPSDKQEEPGRTSLHSPFPHLSQSQAPLFPASLHERHSLLRTVTSLYNSVSWCHLFGEHGEKDAAERRTGEITRHTAVMMGNSHGDCRK